MSTAKEDYDKELARMIERAPKVPGRTYHSWDGMLGWNGAVDEYGRPYSTPTKSYTYSTNPIYKKG